MLQRKNKKQEPRSRNQNSKTALGSWSLVPGSSLVGIGIDLLSLARAKDLLKRHGASFFTRILSPNEKKQKPAVLAQQLARYFTAKEAFFKSSGLNWTDLKGFAGMWITKINGMRFEMECIDSRLWGEGEFFKKSGMWGSKVVTWKI